MNKKNNKIFGIKTVDVNGTKVYTINIVINSSPIILSRILNDEFWKNHHTISMRNGKSKINFLFTTLDSNSIYTVKKSLFDLLFAHKVQKLINESYCIGISDKESILWNTVAEIKNNNRGYL